MVIPAGALDRLEPQRAIGAGAGQDDPDGLLLLVLGQRAEEVINGQPQRHRVHPAPSGAACR